MHAAALQRTTLFHLREYLLPTGGRRLSGHQDAELNPEELFSTEASKMIHFNLKQICAVFAVFLILIMLTHALLTPGEAASRMYKYQVISIGGMTELRTQQNAGGGRMPTLEKIINEQAAAGWEFMQADGYVLYFRK